jgi:iron(III) transport system substrate-binding protein
MMKRIRERLYIPILPLAFSWLAFVLPLTVCALLIACGKDRASEGKSGASQEVVIYTALDQLYSEPILKRFEEKTGIRVRAVYDSEAAKTVGLVNRLIAERERPRCDVFWNNEVLRSIVLKDAGLLEKYQPPNARDIPAPFRDPDGYWTGFGARARVLAYNTDKINPKDLPKTMSDLTAARWRGQIGMGKPLFGSTATHAAVLWSRWGEARARSFFEALKANGVIVFDGNINATRAVADGELAMCLTDSDDANLLKSEGKPIDWTMIDHDGRGALLYPNAISLVHNCPHPNEAKQLIDYLLSPEVEAALAAAPSAQIPLQPGVPAPPRVRAMAQSPFLDVDYAQAAKCVKPSADFLKGKF